MPDLRGTTVGRCVDKGQNEREYRVFCPKAFAGIGDLPDTVACRSIPIRLRKKFPDETVERFREREGHFIGKPICERLEAWAKSAIEILRPARPSLPDQLSDRQQDICEPLVAIADLAGGHWPESARNALVELCTADKAEPKYRS